MHGARMQQPDPATSSVAQLSERDAALLAFELRQWNHAGDKEQAVRTEFGVSAARYYQLLGALIDSPRALAHDPMLVNRLQRMREARARAREYRTGLRATGPALPQALRSHGPNRIEPV